MRFLIIVGARGLGRVLLSQALGDPGNDKVYTFYGFLDTAENLKLPENFEYPIIGNPLTYIPSDRENYLPAVGDPKKKADLLAPLIEKGAIFVDLKTCVSFGERSKNGAGVVFGLETQIGPDCYIGNFVYIDNNSIIGHDVYIGDYCHIGAQTFIGGNVRIGDKVTIHPRATVARGITIGSGAIIGLGAVVIRDVPENTIVLGNPARILKDNT